MEDAAALAPAIILLAGGLLAIVVARASRISPIIGFLAIGLLIGEHGFGLIRENRVTHLLAELGVVFLLFDIGLHFSLKDAKDARRDLLSLAPAQMLLCGAVFALIARTLGCSWPLAAVLGATFALSSTAVVARLLAERQQSTSPLGRSATAVLVFQDIAAVFLLVFASSLAFQGDALAASVGAVALKAVFACIAVVALGRFVAAPSFRFLTATRNEEALPAATLLIVLATATATGAAGLSLTLGAFLAGMIIGETPYKHIIQTETRPFRSLLMGFFFMSVGMALDIAILQRLWPLVLGAAAAIMIIKTGFTFLAARISGWTDPGAVRLASLLGQGSEFALVILAIPAVATGIHTDALAVLLAATSLTLAITPTWSWLGMQLSLRLTKSQPHAAPAANANQPHPVLVFGLTDVGRLAVDALRSHKLPYLAVENDAERFARARADGYDVTFGDVDDWRFMQTISATDARAVVLGAPDFATSRDRSPMLRARFPRLQRFTALSDPAERLRFDRIGVKAFPLEADPPGLELAEALLTEYDVAPEKIREWSDDVRGLAAEADDPASAPTTQAA